MDAQTIIFDETNHFWWPPSIEISTFPKMLFFNTDRDAARIFASNFHQFECFSSYLLTSTRCQGIMWFSMKVKWRFSSEYAFTIVLVEQHFFPVSTQFNSIFACFNKINCENSTFSKRLLTLFSSKSKWNTTRNVESPCLEAIRLEFSKIIKNECYGKTL